jgi:predicted component of type VI protein secretion system
MSDLRLVPVSGPVIDVVKDQSMVGRDPSCEVVVTDGSVSRRHARLERRGAAWWVIDQGSANGTYVNSLRVAEQELRHGQELRFGALSYRVEIQADPEATVATPALADDSATLMAPSSPPPVPPAPPSVPPPIPTAAPAPPRPPTTPPRAAAAPPPAPPSAAAARERFKQPGAASPVPQMPAGAPPAKKGRSPLFWVAVGCCGCLLLVALLIAVIGGGAYMATKPVSNAAQVWLGEVRQSRMDEAAAGLSSEYRARVSQEELQALAEAIQRSKDATFLQRSVDNDKAVLKGVLTGGGSPQPITIHLVKEGGTWKVDDVRLGVE